jgi:hypothetical protein
MKLAILFVFALSASCAFDPSDDPNDWNVDTSKSYRAVLSQPRFVVPSSALPVVTNASNNNVAIEFFHGRLYLAWRTAPEHWASPDTVMHIISSPDDGKTWDDEATFAVGSDLREPQLYVADDTLLFNCFEGGTDFFTFTPKAMWRAERVDDGKWSKLETWGDDPSEVPWEVKKRDGVIWMSSYTGNHYHYDGTPDVRIHFRKASDGRHFVDVGAKDVHDGGSSESGFEFDADGSLWADIRNEDGDKTGFGSMLCHAPAHALAQWDCGEKSDPERRDSPRMFRHGDDVFLVARRDIGGPFDENDTSLSFNDQSKKYAADYWNRPKRTTLYHIDKAAHKVEPVVDLPSAGDTAFASIRRTGADSFLVANYTSPLSDPNRSWIEGQGSTDGTSIYLIDIKFVADGPAH